MRIYYLFILIFWTFIGCQNKANSNESSTDVHDHSVSTESATAKKPLSPHTSAMANVGDLHVHVDYSSPGKRGRIIWNGLVAFNQVWVAGAHNATSIDFSKDVIIGGQTVPKGKYAFFAIPNESEWTLIVNENYDQHLTDDYDQALDVVRMIVKPEMLKESVESLTYEVVDMGEGKGRISMAWDKLKVDLPFEIK